jgi:hypothetical protein
MNGQKKQIHCFSTAEGTSGDPHFQCLFADWCSRLALSRKEASLPTLSRGWGSGARIAEA